jgi:hypothetical protein
MEVEQHFAIKFFADEGTPGAKSPHVSDNILGTVHSLEHKCTFGSTR